MLVFENKIIAFIFITIIVFFQLTTDLTVTTWQPPQSDRGLWLQLLLNIQKGSKHHLLVITGYVPQIFAKSGVHLSLLMCVAGSPHSIFPLCCCTADSGAILACQQTTPHATTDHTSCHNNAPLQYLYHTPTTFKFVVHK